MGNSSSQADGIMREAECADGSDYSVSLKPGSVMATGSNQVVRDCLFRLYRAANCKEGLMSLLKWMEVIDAITFAMELHPDDEWFPAQIKYATRQMRKVVRDDFGKVQ